MWAYTHITALLFLHTFKGEPRCNMIEHYSGIYVPCKIMKQKAKSKKAPCTPISQPSPNYWLVLHVAGDWWLVTPRPSVPVEIILATTFTIYSFCILWLCTCFWYVLGSSVRLCAPRRPAAAAARQPQRRSSRLTRSLLNPELEARRCHIVLSLLGNCYNSFFLISPAIRPFVPGKKSDRPLYKRAQVLFKKAITGSSCLSALLCQASKEPGKEEQPQKSNFR